MGDRLQTQDRLIEAAREIIINEGMEATSLEHICKATGFTRGAFYSNFSSKDSLLAALAEEEYAGLIERLRATVERWSAPGDEAAPPERAGIATPRRSSWRTSSSRRSTRSASSGTSSSSTPSSSSARSATPNGPSVSAASMRSSSTNSAWSS